ncbi:STAS domain-containing protein [Piscinibacter sakaiensis]|uniref:STAS domain-containing protein n=1 Tax=Piscinibacter sakaiensis TaxID=1547922 RepID=A0A0K8NXW0_PISS1|nr:STAS domain-containing protein [Piscinibacter sakaiensis]GAP35139.1 hypothetical protein ISF6_0710 [Piscinibacter sakaiensis]
MSDGKDNRSFFRRVVNFVTPSGGERGADGERGSEFGREDEFAKSELKAMIERKRRNDFVRKRELDMLRKLRREGLTPAQLAALGSSSGMADTESGRQEVEAAPPGMKAKIDEIEQQMAGHAIPSGSRRVAPPAARPPAEEPTAPGALGPADPGAAARAVADTVIDGARVQPPAGRPAAATLSLAPADLPAHGFSPTLPAPAPGAPPTEPSPSIVMRTLSLSDSQSPTALEVSEAVHDPELDEAVIAYANGDDAHAERLLLSLIRAGGPRSHHAETWMVLFDLYRATGQQLAFEPLALEFAERLGRSAPQWFSMPRRAADAAARQTGPRARPRAEAAGAAGAGGPAGWTSPAVLDAAAVDALRKRTLSLPLPWVLDWGALTEVAEDARGPLLELLQHWAPQPLDMRWQSGEQLLEVLARATPVGERQVDPRLWQLRLQMLRLAHRPDKFDEVAIDCCVTYEVSPPSWEPAACRVRLGGVGGAPTAPLPSTLVGEGQPSQYDSQPDAALAAPARLELGGQLTGDIAPVLARLDRELGAATMMEISCAHLLRVDFMAAGDLLNWVLARNREHRVVGFVDAHRLVALFFSAMGIDAHASVKLAAA